MSTQKNRVWKFGDNIDTDLIIAARYLNTSDPKELAKYVMEDANPVFKNEVRAGDIVVAGENFGCGSSREHAPIALKAAGVQAVVAKSFARIFYRNAFNMGLAIYEIAESDTINEEDTLEILPQEGIIKNKTQNKEYRFKPIPPFMLELIEAGGLMELAKKEIAHA